MVMVVVLLAGAGVCVWAMLGRGVSAHDSVLLSLFLTALSVAASWLASRYYADYSFNNNLRTFALKAAEKVDNLSQELDRLTAYLQQELTDWSGEGGTPPVPTTEALRLKDARIESAIHIIGTLKSVNDRSLSDWQSVIGEELDTRQRRRRKQESDLKDLVVRLETLYSESQQANAGAPATSARGEELAREVEALKGDLSLLVSQVSGVTVRRKPAKAQRESVQNECPQCAQTVVYRQRPIPNSIVNVICPQCDAHLYSRCEAGEFLLRSRDPVVEKIACPACAKANRVEIDPVPGGPPVEERCRRCDCLFRVSRTTRGLSVKWLAAALPATPVTGETPDALALTEATIERVRVAMPAQPWPKGASRATADRLGLPLEIVNEAVDELIARGAFRTQSGGAVVALPPVHTVVVPKEEPAVLVAGRR